MFLIPQMTTKASNELWIWPSQKLELLMEPLVCSTGIWRLLLYPQVYCLVDFCEGHITQLWMEYLGIPIP